MYVQNRSGEFNYESLGITVYTDKKWDYTSSNALELINNGQGSLNLSTVQNNFVFIAKPKFIKTNVKIKSLNKQDLVFVTFKPIVNLIGKKTEPIWFSNSVDQITPVLDPSNLSGFLKIAYVDFLEKENQQAKSHSGFAFWDHLIMPKPSFLGPDDGYSCAPKTYTHFDENRYYLIIGTKNGDFVRTEPLSGLDDPLISVVKKQLDKKDSNYIRKQISAKSYFENMKFAAPVKLQSCSAHLLKANRKTDWWDPYTKFTYSLERRGVNLQGAEFTPLNKHKRKISKTLVGHLNHDWPALFEYYGDKDLKGVTCKGHEEFLVFGYHNRSAYPFHLKNQNEPKGGVSELRFAKIVNGQVIVASIKTNYQIQSPNKIPLEDVLSWIPDTEYDPWVWTEK